MPYFQILLCGLTLSNGLVARSHAIKISLCSELHHAVRHNDLATVTRLLDEDRANNIGKNKTTLANCHIRKEWRPLHAWARIGGSAKIFFKLLYSGSAVLDAKSQDGLTPFLVAAAYQQKHASIALMSARTIENPVNINAQDKRGFSALHLAVIGGGDNEWAKRLLDWGVDPSLLDDNERTASMLAAKKGMEDMRYLLSPVDIWKTIAL